MNRCLCISFMVLSHSEFDWNLNFDVVVCTCWWPHSIVILPHCAVIIVMCRSDRIWFKWTNQRHPYSPHSSQNLSHVSHYRFFLIIGAGHTYILWICKIAKSSMLLYSGETAVMAFMYYRYSPLRCFTNCNITSILSCYFNV